jgi:hypothetical protein
MRGRGQGSAVRVGGGTAQDAIPTYEQPLVNVAEIADQEIGGPRNCRPSQSN